MEIDWLDECPRCGYTIAEVLTDSQFSDELFEGDEVICKKCGLKGIIRVDDSFENEQPVILAEWDSPDEN